MVKFYKFNLKYLRKNISSFIALTTVIVVVAVFCAYSLLHFFWLDTLRNIDAPTIRELKIVSTTIYTLVFVCSFFALSQVGKATIHFLSRDFAQLRMLGCTPKEVIKIQLFISFCLSLAGALIGTIIGAVTFPLILPLLNAMAYTQTPLPTSYTVTIKPLALCFFACAITTFITSVYSVRNIKRINPLTLFKEREQAINNQARHSILRRILSFIFLGYALILLVCTPIIPSLDHTLEVTYNFSSHIGIALTAYIFCRPKLIVRCREKYQKMLDKKRFNHKVTFSYALNEIEMLWSGVGTLLFGLDLGGVLLLSGKAVELYAHFRGFELSVNYSDSIFLFTIVAVIAVTTGFAILSLNSLKRKETYTKFYKKFVSYREAKHFAFLSSFYLSIMLISEVAFPLFAINVFVLLLTGISVFQILALTFILLLAYWAVVFGLSLMLYIFPAVSIYQKPGLCLRSV